MNQQILYAALSKPLYAFELDIELELTQTGNSLAILGPSGSGKSMALRMISGLVEPAKGLVNLNGRSLFDSGKEINIPPRKRRIGYVFQNYALFPHMTVAQNIMFGMPKIAAREREQRCQQLLREIRLKEYASRYPSQLSGGQQQRVALARVLAAEPELLLLDEPFSALDAELRGELEALLLGVRESRRIPYILVTHNLEEAYRLCDHLAVIENGRILQTGPKKEMLKQPQNLETARRLGAKNLWPAELRKREGRGGEVFVPLLNELLWVNELPEESESFWLGIRPSEAVLLNGAEPGRRNTFPVMINRIVQGVRSHTLVVAPGADNPYSMEAELILEVPVHRHHFNSPTIYLPPDKLFAIPKNRN